MACQQARLEAALVVEASAKVENPGELEVVATMGEGATAEAAREGAAKELVALVVEGVEEVAEEV